MVYACVKSFGDVLDIWHFQEASDLLIAEWLCYAFIMTPMFPHAVDGLYRHSSPAQLLRQFIWILEISHWDRCRDTTQWIQSYHTLSLCLNNFHSEGTTCWLWFKPSQQIKCHALALLSPLQWDGEANQKKQPNWNKSKIIIMIMII